MRVSKGKLISVWVPGNHGAGGSTIAIALGIAMQHIINKRVLIVNMGSCKNYMEQYMQNDVKTSFSMDYLKSFGDGITQEHIKIYASAVNDYLYILPNCKLDKLVSRAGESFYERFIEEALEAFDVVIVDLETSINKEKQLFLDKADQIIAVLNNNVIMLKELFEYSTEVSTYIYNSKTLPLFNALHHEGREEKDLSRLNRSLKLNASFGVNFDVGASNAACRDGKLYSFLKRELSKKRSSSTLAVQMLELGSLITDRLLIPVEKQSKGERIFSSFFSRARQWGGVDV
jgi:Flp pilus assembly CpaE family ATPase